MKRYIIGSLMLVAVLIVAIRLAGGQPGVWLHPMFFGLLSAILFRLLRLRVEHLQGVANG